MKHRCRVPAALLRVFVPVVLCLGSPAAHAHPAVVPALTATGDAAARRVAPIIDAASRRHGVDPALVHAIVFVESSYDPEAVSSQGALGLMQLMPVTCERYGVRDPFDPAQNVDGGVRFLKDLLDLFEGDVELTIAAYNAGASAVIRAGYQIPANAETLAFVPRVLWYYQISQSVAQAHEPPVEEPSWTVATHEPVLRLAVSEPAREPVGDRDVPPLEREKRPVGIVSSRRSSRWRLGRVRFSGAASGLFASAARETNEPRGAGKSRRAAPSQPMRVVARRSASSRKVKK